MLFSTIITSYKTHDVTAAHVREIMRFPVKPDEIIVVDDAGDPGLRDLLFNLKRTVPVTYAKILQDISWNYTGARNLGIWLSRGKYLASEDSDNIPDPTFYPLAIQLLDEHPGVHKVVSQTRRKITIDEISKPLEEWRTCGSRPRHIHSGLYRRSSVVAAKAFNEEFAGFYGRAEFGLVIRFNAISQNKEAVCYDRKYGCAVLKGAHYYVMCGLEDRDGFNRRSRVHNIKLHKAARKRFEDTGIFTHPKGILNFDYGVEILDLN